MPPASGCEDPGMTLTARRLNRATLARQLLLRREPLDAVEGIRRIVAVQAQEPASPYLALWNRLADFEPGQLDAAFADGSVVKTSLLRITLHAVLASEYPTFHDAMRSSLRASRLNDRRFTDSGLTVTDVDALIEPLLEAMTRPHTKAEVEALIEARLGEPAPWAWWALRTFAPLYRAPTGGPWSFGPKQSFIAARVAMAPTAPGSAVAWLLRRYLEAFGPASVADVAQFTLLRRPVIHQAIVDLGDEVVAQPGPDGTTLYDAPGASVPDADTTAPPRLLPMWDSVLLAYADRSRVIPPDHRRLVIRTNGDVLPTLLVDGYVAGVWRPVDGGIEATAFQPLSDAAWAGLAAEASALVAFLADRDPNVYRRYARWWASMPTSEVRLLPGALA